MHFFIFLCMSILCIFMCFLSANRFEPAFTSKQVLLNLLQQTFQNENQTVIKPVWGTHNGKGVRKKSLDWTIPICENLFQVSCYEQPYHEGPWEGRMIREFHHWKTTAWLVPWLFNNEPPRFYAEFPWEKEVQENIMQLFPDSPFLAIDFRTNGTNVLILEINGAYGLNYDFIFDENNFAFVMFQWFVKRAIHGFFQPDLWFSRLSQIFNLWSFKYSTRSLPSQVWF